jgi:hypothetical protein
MLALLAGLSPTMAPARAAGEAVALSQTGDAGRPGTVHTIAATVTGADGHSVADGTPVTFTISGPTRGITVGSPVVDAAVTRDGQGAWVLREDGSVTPQGNARSFGDAAGASAAAVAIAATPTGAGYWIALANGNVKAFGDAPAKGSMANPPAPPVADLAAHPSGAGYWLVTADGSVSAFGDASSYGSAAQPAGASAIAIGPTSTGNGYWVLGTGGAVASFGDAVFYGDTHNLKLNRPISDFAITADGKGYWFVADDGGIFAFGSSKFNGSAGGRAVPGAVVAIVGQPDGRGYVMAGRDGLLYYFGDGASPFDAGYVVRTIGGRATLKFTSSLPGTSTVGATLASGTAATPLQFTWLSGPAVSLTLTPGETPGSTGQPVLLAIVVHDAQGYVAQPTAVDFTTTPVADQQNPPGRVTTSGWQTYVSFTSNRAGPMTVTATAGNLSATATINWATAPPSPPPTRPTAITLDSSNAAAPGEDHTVTATVTGDGGQTVRDGTTVTFTVVGPFGARTSCSPAAALAFSPGGGRWLIHADGAVDSLAGPRAPEGPAPLSSAVADVAATPTGGGYWVATADGRVLTSGDARSYGDARDLAAGRPVLRMAATPSGRGYWLLHRDGSISAFGDAPMLGSVGPDSQRAPLVAFMPTTTGAGYWVVGSDGSVYAFGDAGFFGDTHAVRLFAPIADATRTATGGGYWFVDRAGGIFSFGDAGFYGNATLAQWNSPAEVSGPVTRIVASPTSQGYLLVTTDASVWSYGDAPELPAGTGCRTRTAGGRATLQFSSGVPGHSQITAYAQDVSATAGMEWRSDAPRTKSGYWMLGAAGGVFPFGDAVHHGEPDIGAGVQAVDLESTPGRGGYWVVDSTGVVRAFGDAKPLGNADRRNFTAGETISSLSATPSGAGYWVFTNRGRVLTFGDARFFGDMAAVKLNGPVLDSIATPSGAGYYMVASDGGIFAFGDARFAGSMGGRPLNKPVQSLVPDGDGSGYWLVASDGGIFAFEAPFRGSMGGTRLNKPVKGMVRYGDGYLMVATDGGIFSFSDKPFAGSLGADPPAQAIVSVAATG